MSTEKCLTIFFLNDLKWKIDFKQKVYILNRVAFKIANTHLIT